MYKIFLILLCCFISSFSVEVTIYGKIYAKVPFKPSFTVVVSQQNKIDATIYTNQGGSLPQWSFKSDWPTSCWPYDPVPNDTFSWGKVSVSREGYVITPAIRYYSAIVQHDMGNQDFNAVDTMDPVIQVDSPATGEIIILNSPDPSDPYGGRITWCGVDNSRSCMRRDYYVSYNNGRNYTLIKTINTDLICSGNNWHYEKVKHVFDTISDSCLVKIVAMDFDSNTGMDCSGIFRVVDTVRPTITVTSPNGGEKWYTGQTHNITWTASDNVTLMSRSIYYSTDNGANWILMDSSGNAGFSLPWVLSCTPSNQYKIRIRVFDQSGNSQEDVSNNIFEIIDTATIDTLAPVVTLIYPTAGVVLTLGKTYDIIWNATDNKGVVSRAIYRKWNASSWILMDSSNTNTGTWAWQTPVGIDLIGWELMIKAYDAHGHCGTAYSGKFDIKDLTPPIVNIIHPQKGKIYTYIVRLNFSASYESNDIWNRIVARSFYYSLDGGNNYTFLDSTADTLSPVFKDMSWYAQYYASSRAKIRVYVYDSKGNRGMKDSDSLFTVKDIFAPQIGISDLPPVIEAGTKHMLVWSASDFVGVVRVILDLSVDSGKTYTNIDTVSPDTGKYLWSVPANAEYPHSFIRATAFDAAGNDSAATTRKFSISLPVSIKPCTMPVKFGVLVMREVIQIGMEKAGKVSISLYDLKGRRVWVREEVLSVGYHRINRRPMALGLYILRVVRADKSLRIKYVKVY